MLQIGTQDGSILLRDKREKDIIEVDLRYLVINMMLKLLSDNIACHYYY